MVRSFLLPRRALCVALLTSLAGCTEQPDLGDPPPPLTVGDGCQPLLAEVEGEPVGDCFFPFPSDFYRTDDDTLPSGATITFEGDARPATAAGNDANPLNWRPADGYSRLPPILVRFGKPLSKEGLVTIGTDYDLSCAEDSKTLIFEAETGTCVPHFVDLDDAAADTPDRQALILRPQVLLEPETRYVVALRGLLDVDGNAIAAPAGYRYLAEGLSDPGGHLEGFAQQMEAGTLAPLRREGIEPTSLQLAWHFTTGSEVHVQGDMLRVRELALAALEGEAPVVTITDVVEGEDAEIWRRVEGTVRVPMFLESTGPGASLNRNAAGEVVQDGTTEVPFTAVIPASVRDGAAPGFPLMYGHGFFGSREEATYGRHRFLLNEIGAVGFALDWWGMAAADAGIVLASLGDEVHTAMQFSERVPQAMVNFIALTMAIDHGLVVDDAFRRPDAPDVAGTPGDLVFDGPPDYLGISQGHILGATLVPLNPFLERAVLHVGGVGLSHLMTRSSTFKQFLDVLNLAVTDPQDKQVVVALMQTHLDRVDGATYAPYLAGAPFPGSEVEARPPVLMQLALGDASVPNFGGLMHARQLGLDHIGPPPTTLWGIEEVGPQPSGSGLTLYDVGIDPAFYAVAAPQEENPAHQHIRIQGPVLDQMQTFLQSGELIYPCDGLCHLPVD